MLIIGSVVASFLCVTFAAIARGPCNDAKKGGVYEKCSMNCEWDGSCVEMTYVETCECNNRAVFTAMTYNFKVRSKSLLHEQEF